MNIFDRAKPNYCVYNLINHTKKEIYYGITKQIIQRFSSHFHGNTKSLKNWNFRKDQINKHIVIEGLTKTKASNKAHSLEKRGLNRFLYPDYKILQTRGL